MPNWSDSVGVGGGGDACGGGGGDSCGGGGGDAADSFGDGVRDIRLSKKQRKWHRRLVYAATAKSPCDFLHRSQQIDKGNYNCFLLLLSLKKQAR